MSARYPDFTEDMLLELYGLEKISYRSDSGPQTRIIKASTAKKGRVGPMFYQLNLFNTFSNHFPTLQLDPSWLRPISNLQHRLLYKKVDKVDFAEFMKSTSKLLIDYWKQCLKSPAINPAIQFLAEKWPPPLNFSQKNCPNLSSR